MAISYWRNIVEHRIDRRRLLAHSGMAAAGAAFLAACGGSNNSGSGSSGSSAKSGLVIKPADETSKAVTGGKLVAASRPLESLDPIGSSAIGINFMMYSTLWRKKAAHLGPYAGDVAGDLAEKWEVSPDQQQINLTITSKAHFQGSDGSSFNSREVTAKDVAYTWGRYLKVGALRDEVANPINPNSPVVSMTATDNKTVVIKLARPDATIFGLLSQQRAGNFYVLPEEAETIDIKHISIGSGPWVLNKWQAGVGQFFKKNPGYHQDWRGENLPYLDTLELPELPETALAEAQMRSGGIQVYSNYIPQEDILSIKRDVPALEIYAEDPISTSMRIIMGNAPGSPFLDERVRQAAMLLMDRDLMIDTLGNTKAFESAGLPVTRTLDSAMAVDQPGFWFLDPRSKDFGENTKYFVYDPKQAQALLTAAGYPNGLDTTMIMTSGYNPGILNKMNVVEAAFGGGHGGAIRYKLQDLNYQTEWSPKVRFAKGAQNGVALLQDVDTPDPALYIYQRYNPNGGVFQGGDATMTDLSQKAKAEFDPEARKKLVYEMQKYEGKTLHFPLSHGGATTFVVNWPCVRNWDVYKGELSTGTFYNTLWRDPTKDPKA